MPKTPDLAERLLKEKEYFPRALQGSQRLLVKPSESAELLLWTHN